MEVAAACVKELGTSSHVDLTALAGDVSLVLNKSFQHQLRSHLDPVWHEVGRKTKQLLKDIEVLRRLAVHLLKYDSVTFFEHLEALKKKCDILFYLINFIK